MDAQLLRIFQGELRTQCTLVRVGATFVNYGMANHNSDVVWFALQGMLVSAANASKLLWGSRAELVLEARRPLRDSVGVTDSSPLNDRRLRNDFEHFDERVERWFANDPDRMYVGRIIGGPEAIVIEGEAPRQRFGMFDPARAEVTFWSNTSDLNSLGREATRILASLDADRPD
jgi:hypothetical protein